MRTRLGAMTIACAAVVGRHRLVSLAVVVGLVRAGEARQPLALTLGGSASTSRDAVPPRGAARSPRGLLPSRGRLTQDMLALILVACWLSAWTTEWLGIHALFGAFLVGAIMPRDSGLVHELREKLEDVTVVFLLPLFFAFTGLRTQIGLLSGAELWLDCGLIVLVAMVASSAARRWRRGSAACLARGGRARRADEHARPDRAGLPHHRPRDRHHLAGPVHDDGADGAGHHVHDPPLLEWIYPAR